MVETELVVKIASGGAAQTVRDVAKVQEALAQMGKSAKDTAALAKALGNAFNLDPSEVEDLANAMEQAKIETGKLGDEVEKTAKKAKTLDEVMTGFLRRLGERGFDLAVDSLRAMGDAIQNTARQALDISDAFDAAGAKVRTLGVDSDELEATLTQVNQGLGGQANQLELLQGSYDIVSAGFADVGDIANIVEASVKGATGGFSDFATVSDGVTSALNAYGESADQAESFVSKFIETQNKGKITVDQYAQQIGQLAPTAALAGIGIDELNGFIATATAQGVPVESTFSGIRQAISSTLKPTAQASTLVEELNSKYAGLDLQFDASALSSEGLAGILGRLNSQGLDTAENLLTLFGSVEAVAAIAPSAGQNFATLGENIAASANSAGAATSAFDTMTGSALASQTAISNLVTDGFLALGQSISPIKEGVLAFASSLLSATIEGTDGLGELRSASERFQTVLANNPDIVDRLAKALATLADTGVQQLSLLLDGVTAFVAEKDNIDQIGQSLESVAVVITRLGQTARFIVALADGILTLKTRLDELPPAAEGFKQALDVTGATQGFQVLGGVVELLNQTFLVLNATVDSTKNFIKNLVERFDFLGNNPVVKALIGQILETETAAVGLGTALARSASAGAEAMGDLGKAADAAAKSAQDAKDASTPPPPPPPGDTVSPLAGLVEANRNALDDIATDNDNARAALLEGGGTQAQLTALERKALEDRVAQNRTYLQQLKNLQATGGLTAEDAQQLADTIRDVEGRLAQDRVTLAQQVVNARRDAEQDAAKAAEDAAKAQRDAAEATAKAQAEAAADAAKAQQEATEAAAKAQAEALKDARDEAQRLADQAFGDAQKEEGVLFSEAQAAKAEAFQEAQQADQEAFNDQQQGTAKAFQDGQQARAKAFQDSQQAAAKAFQKSLDDERDKGSREFDVLTSEVERRIQLEEAANAQQRRELEEQFKLEDEQLEKRRKVEAEVLRERGQILADRREETQLSPLEQARADFEAKLQAKAEAFQLAQLAEREAFDVQQQLESEAFEAGQRDAERAFQAEQKAEAKAFRDAQKEEDRAFQSAQQDAERAFKDEQRRLDRENAQQIAAILESAKARGIDGARRDGGPVRSGGTYLVGEDGPELVTPRRGGYVYTAQQTAALMAGLPTMRGVSVPALGSTAKLEGLMGDLLQEVRKGRQVRPQSTYNLTTAAPVQDAMALQLAEIRALMDRRGL